MMQIVAVASGVALLRDVPRSLRATGRLHSTKNYCSSGRKRKSLAHEVIFKSLPLTRSGARLRATPEAVKLR